MSRLSETLYAKYIKDRESLEILEGDDFFVTYKINGDELFIKDMCVDESVRGIGKMRAAIGELIIIALGSACKVISANIFLDDKGANNALIAALLVGFEVKDAQNKVLLIVKNVGI